MAASKRSSSAKRRSTSRRRSAKRPSGSAAREKEEVREETSPPSSGERRGKRVVQATSRAASAAATAALDASRRAVEATPTIVLRAASIIEEEVASGIGAVKRIEQRFLDVDTLRAQHPDHVMSRFRRDAHEAVDIILDIVTAAASTVGEQAGRMVNVSASYLPQRPGSAGTKDNGGSTRSTGIRLSTVRMPGTIAPGGRGELTMSLENESDAAVAEFTLHSSELVSASGYRIPADHVSFDPATLSVAPRASGMVKVTIRVPLDATPGSYEGLLRATQLDGLRAMLVVQVA